MIPEEVHAHRHHPTGHRWLDLILGGSALLISCVSLFVAVEHGHTMKKLVEANSWPNLTLANSLQPDTKTEGLVWEIAFRNNGIGPARLRTLEIWDGQTPLHNFHELARDLRSSLGLPVGALNANTESVVGDVIGANEKVVMLGLPFPELKPGESLRLGSRLSALRERYCFCSVFEDCFVVDSAVSRESRKVNACPKPKVMFDDDIMTASGDERNP